MVTIQTVVGWNKRTVHGGIAVSTPRMIIDTLGPWPSPCQVLWILSQVAVIRTDGQLG